MRTTGIIHREVNMKDYLEHTPYNPDVKNVIMQIAKRLYFNDGNTTGWQVCDDDNRDKYVEQARRIYQDDVVPFLERERKELHTLWQHQVINRLCNVMKEII
jgi:hypothetical protein